MNNLPFILNSSNDLLNKIQLISHALLLLLESTAVLFIIIGGFQLIFSFGNKEQIQRGKRTILYAIIGLLIALLSQSIVVFIFQALIQ